MKRGRVCRGEALIANEIWKTQTSLKAVDNSICMGSLTKNKIKKKHNHCFSTQHNNITSPMWNIFVLMLFPSFRCDELTIYKKNVKYNIPSPITNLIIWNPIWDCQSFYVHEITIRYHTCTENLISTFVIK